MDLNQEWSARSGVSPVSSMHGSHGVSYLIEPSKVEPVSLMNH